MKRYLARNWLPIVALPLSSMIIGTTLAIADFKVKPSVVLVLFFTAFVLKMVSVVRENKARFSTENKYKAALWASVLLFLGLAVLLVYLSYGSLWCLDAFVFLLLGYFFLRTALFPVSRPIYLDAIYTISLYGPLAVVCAYMLCAHTITGWHLLLPAFAIGFLVAAAKDVVKPLYHTLLIVAGFVYMIISASYRIFDLYHFLFLLSLPLFIVHLVRYWREPKPSKLLIWSILLFAILSGIGYLLFPLFGVSAIIF